MKNAGKACNNRLYRHIRTFEKIVKNYFVIYIKYVSACTKIAAGTSFAKAHPRASCRVVLKYSLGVIPYSFLKARKKWL